MNEINPCCEACRLAPQETVIEEDEPRGPYRLCRACTQRLTTYSLRPLEWFRLAAIHGPFQFFLHDDFYTENGEAQQPDVEVVEPERWPIPMLAEIAGELNMLVDYAMTRWLLRENSEIIVFLKQHDQHALLAELQRRAALLPPLSIEASIYEICAYALGPAAGSWIRSRWNGFRPDVFPALAHASAFCLPCEEGFRRVTEVLETLPPRELLHVVPVLASFRTALTLDWLETHVQSPVTITWGSVAACSQFTWERAVKWLNQGRPLSLIALDALQMRQSSDVSSQVFGAATREEIHAVLKAYTLRDPVPRVKQAVAALLNSECMHR